MQPAKLAERKATSGISVLDALGLIFVTLKLCGVIHWQWWLVTLPLWIVYATLIAVMLATLLLGGAMIGLANAMEWVDRRYRHADRGTKP